MSGDIANADYAGADRTLRKKAGRRGFLLAENAMLNALKECWPDMRQRFVNKRSDSRLTPDI